MKFLSGKKALPSKEEMQANTDAEMQRRWDKGYKKRQAHMMGDDQVNSGPINSLRNWNNIFIILF